MRKRQIVSAALFLAIALVLLFLCTRVLTRKSLFGAWDMTNKIAGFYNEPDNEFEILFFGSSNAYAAFSPLELWHETGVKSYVFATQQQPMWATYHYILEALKTQSPAVIVVDTQMMIQTGDYAEPSVVHSYLDDLPFSLNKLALIRVSAAGADRLEYLLPIIRYHDRWEELKPYDFTLDRSSIRDMYKGYVLLPGTGFVPTVYDAPVYDVLVNQKSLSYLLRIADLCDERGIELWLTETPSNPDTDQQAVFAALKKELAGRGLYTDDHNGMTDEIGLSPGTDFYDQHHLNARGAQKYTDWFAARLTERYPALKTDPSDPLWTAEYKAYVNAVSASLTSSEG